MYDSPKATCGQSAEQFQRDSLERLGKVAPVAQQPRSEIAVQLEQQEKLTHSLLDSIQALEQKLAPLVVSGPENAKGADVQACGSQLGSRIAANSARVLGAIQRVQRLISDLAV